MRWALHAVGVSYVNMADALRMERDHHRSTVAVDSRVQLAEGEMEEFISSSERAIEAAVALAISMPTSTDYLNVSVYGLSGGDLQSFGRSDGIKQTISINIDIYDHHAPRLLPRGYVPPDVSSLLTSGFSGELP